MFINFEYIKDAISNLEFVHPFYGIIFLVCKQNQLPIDDVERLPIGKLETEFLEKYYHPDKESEYFYRLFRVSDKSKHWVHQKKYATSTLQSIRTQSTFANAFLHERKSDVWGWQPDYVNILDTNLNENAAHYKSQPIPAFYLAVWLYREREWLPQTTADDIIETFFLEFLITEEESVLFDKDIPTSLYSNSLLQ